MALLQLTVRALSGQIVLGPESIAGLEPIAVLKRRVADKWNAQSNEVLLTFGDSELQSDVSLTDAGVPDGALIQAVRLDLAEVAERALKCLLSTCVEHAEVVQMEPLAQEELLVSCDDPEKIPDKEKGMWLTGISESCGCRLSGFHKEVEGMLEAIRESGKIFGQSSVRISASILKHNPHGPGLLCLETRNSQDGFRTTLVDLTGEVAEIFGAPADRYPGAVWGHHCNEEDFGDILYNLGLGEELSIPKWKALARQARDMNRPELLPHPLSRSVTAFFSKWAADGSCPSFDVRNPPTFKIPEVDEFKDATKRFHEEKRHHEEVAKQQRYLRQIFAYLDRGGKGYLSFPDLHPLWEVGGWLIAGSDTDGVDNEFACLCKDKGFEASDRISEPAFTACFVHMPFSPDTTEYYYIEDGAITHTALKDYLITLRAGPHCKGHYLGPLKRHAIVRRAAVYELFQLLDGDGDGYLNSSELRPFVELMHSYHPGGWDPPPLTPFGRNHGAFSESASMERWCVQFKELCEARSVPMGTGFSEVAFSEYVEEMNINHTELAWAAERIRTSPPPGGHHMSWDDFISTNYMVNGGGLENAGVVAQLKGYASPLFENLYEWALQGSPRSLTFLHEGVEYSVTVIPERQHLPDDWNLVERAPKVYEWILEPKA